MRKCKPGKAREFRRRERRRRGSLPYRFSICSRRSISGSSAGQQDRHAAIVVDGFENVPDECLHEISLSGYRYLTMLLWFESFWRICFSQLVYKDILRLTLDVIFSNTHDKVCKNWWWKIKKIYWNYYSYVFVLGYIMFFLLLKIKHMCINVCFSN